MDHRRQDDLLLRTSSAARLANLSQREAKESSARVEKATCAGHFPSPQIATVSPPTPAPAQISTSEKGEKLVHIRLMLYSELSTLTIFYLVIHAFKTIHGMPSRSWGLPRPGMKHEGGPGPQ